MNRNRIILLGISALLVGFCVGAALFYVGGQALAAWRAPLGPSLDLPTASSLNLTAPAPLALKTPTLQPTRTPFPTFEIPGTPTSLSYARCGHPGVMIFLAIGSDVRGDNYTYGLSDAIRIVRVDFVTPRITILEFPRDLYVEIPDISQNYGITHGKLNQAYLYGQPGFDYYDGPGGGPGLLARTLDLNFGLRVDHYGAINMQTFVRLVDAVGGIDVTLQHTINGNAADSNPQKKELIFTAGSHHLNGRQAIILARLRPNGVFERAESQNIVLCALRDEILTPRVLGDIPDLVKSFQHSVLTDLSPEEIGQLACLAPSISGDNLVFAHFPESLFTGTRVDDPILGNTFIWAADFAVLRQYTAEFVAGNWPPIYPAPPPADDATPVPGDSSFCP